MPQSPAKTIDMLVKENQALRRMINLVLEDLKCAGGVDTDKLAAYINRRMEAINQQR